MWTPCPRGYIACIFVWVRISVTARLGQVRDSSILFVPEKRGSVLADLAVLVQWLLVRFSNICESSTVILCRRACSPPCSQPAIRHHETKRGAQKGDVNEKPWAKVGWRFILVAARRSECSCSRTNSTTTHDSPRLTPSFRAFLLRCHSAGFIFSINEPQHKI